MKKIIKKIKNDKGPAPYEAKGFRSGFVILFAVTISSILLAIALGVANIALKEIKFGTNARDTNDAFFAADTGSEYALYFDKSTINAYPAPGPYSFVVSGSSVYSSQGCAIVTVDKTVPLVTTIISKGYNTGGGNPGVCNPGTNSVERELRTTYSNSGSASSINFRSSSTAATAGATSLTISPPSGLVDNDVMIAVINANVETTTITPPTGWTPIRSIINAPFSANASTYWKRANSESGDYTFNFLASVRAVGAISSFTGVITSGSPIDVENGQANPSSGTATAPSITTTQANEMLIYASVDDNSPASTWTPPSGMTEAADSNSVAAVTIDYLIQPSAGATGTKVGACTDPGLNASFLFALIPA